MAKGIRRLFKEQMATILRQQQQAMERLTIMAEAVGIRNKVKYQALITIIETIGITYKALASLEREL